MKWTETQRRETMKYSLPQGPHKETMPRYMLNVLFFATVQAKGHPGGLSYLTYV